MSRSSSALLGLAAAIPAAAALCALLLGLGVPIATTWFWPVPDTNIAEAAALGDAARVRTLAAQQVPVDRPLPVRPGLLENDTPAMMSALEAAIRRDSDDLDDLVGVLLELWAAPSPAEALRLYCLAAGREAESVTALLRQRFDMTPESCAARAPEAGSGG